MSQNLIVKDKENNITVDDIFICIENGNIDELKNLIATTNGKNPVKLTKWSGFSSIHKAASVGNIDMCEILLLNGANVNEKTTIGNL